MTIKHIPCNNVNQAFVSGWYHLRNTGLKLNSRNGPVVRAPGPVITEYKRPEQRVLFNPKRDANAVFHLMEAIWMFSGENDVKWLLDFNSKFGQYAEADGIMHGAYGHRWREMFGHDQIERAIEELQENPESRRVVIAMWHPALDQKQNVRDVPCNTHCYVEILEGKLNLTVCNRSNDMVWGAYGSNVVHFSMLQELIAAALDVPIGTYVQFSNNFHVYAENPTVRHFMDNPPGDEFDLYGEGQVDVLPMVDPDAGETWQDFIEDCERLVMHEPTWQPRPEFATRFFRLVAFPLYNLYLKRKSGVAIGPRIDDLPDRNDWCRAFREWYERRKSDE